MDTQKYRLVKKLFFLPFILLSFVACQSQQVTAPPVEKVATATVPTFKVPAHYKGTIPTEGLPIATDYPYNVDLTNVEGTALNSSSTFKKNGKPTVILFWLTTCYPCGLELKALKEKYPKWIAEEDFNFYAVSTDFQKNYANFTKRVSESQWPFEAYHDTNKGFSRVMPGNLNGLPQVFLYDAEGNIVYHKRKYRTGDEDVLFEKIKALK